MMADRDSFEGFWTNVIEDVLNGLENNHSTDFESIVLGEINPSKLDYPCVHIIPDTSNYKGSQEYRDTIKVNYYFEKGHDDPREYLDSLEVMEESLDSMLLELYKDELVGEHKIDRIEHYRGELSNTRLEVVSVDIMISKLFNYSPSR